MRKMEILSIRREHVYLDRQVIYVSKAKAGPRDQPVTEHLARFLADYMETLPTDTPWLFPSADAKDGHTVDIRKPFRRVVAAAGMDPDSGPPHLTAHRHYPSYSGRG
jgi:integrase